MKKMLILLTSHFIMSLSLFATGSSAKTTTLTKQEIPDKRLLLCSFTQIREFQFKKAPAVINNQKKWPTFIGYYWVPYSDGCYYLGAVTVDDAGDIWWDYVGNGGLDTHGFHGATTHCMTGPEFDTFCLFCESLLWQKQSKA